MQLYGHLPLMEIIQVRRTRHVGHGWRSRDQLISDVLQWTPSHRRAKTGRPARTYRQKLCADTGCSPEDLPEAMDDRERWRERVSDICADVAIWWLWWYIYTIHKICYAHVCVCVFIYMLYIIYIYLHFCLYIGNIYISICISLQMTLCRILARAFLNRVNLVWCNCLSSQTGCPNKVKDPGTFC